ncbi:MAG: PAS domain S-box protein, partial [Candidatus Sericytochromatia bacterium]
MQVDKKEILIVEDDVLTSKVISKQLERNNYKTFIVHTGEDSIDAIKNNSSISLVIMDIDLGDGIDGTVAAKEILKIKKIPIIFHTSHSEKEIVEKAKEITRYGYILKNPGEFVLLSAIEMAFQLFESHKKSEENELRWRFALEGSRDGVWDWMVQTGQVFFSKQWKSIIGYEENELENSLEEWDKRLHPDDKKLCYERIHKHFEHKTEYYESEHRLLSKDGTYKWILDRGKVFDWSKDGKPLRMIGTHTDITERKSLEERILISEGNFRTFFDAINEYIFILDEQGNILKVNDFVITNLGYKEEDLISKNITLFHKNCIEYQDKDLKESFFKCIENKLPIFVIQKNNQEISVESKIIKGSWNEKEAFFLVEKDISELKASEEKFSKMFHISSTLMALTDLENDQIIDVNDTFLNVLGYEKNVVLNTPASKINLWFDLEERNKALSLLNRDGKILNFE